MATRASLPVKTSAAVHRGRRAAASFADSVPAATRPPPAATHEALIQAGAACANLRAAAVGSGVSMQGQVAPAVAAASMGAHAGRSRWATFTEDLARHLLAHADPAPRPPRAPRRPRRADAATRPAEAPPAFAVWPHALLASLPQGLVDHLASRPDLAGRLPRTVVNSTCAPLYGMAAGLADPAMRLAWGALCVRNLFCGSGQYFRGIVALNDEPRRRPKTMSRREMLRERRRRERAGEMLEIASYERPQTRADCADGPRPCLFVACKHHLFLDVNPETGSIKINFPDRDVWELEETCALDVAERGGVTLEEVGDILNLTRERVRQVEVTGLGKLKGESPQHELDVFVGWDPHPEEF